MYKKIPTWLKKTVDFHRVSVFDEKWNLQQRFGANRQAQVTWLNQYLHRKTKKRRFALLLFSGEYVVSTHNKEENIMDRFSGPEDIYEELVDNAPEDEEWLFGLVAFAVVEEQKIEWMKHQTENNGDPPTKEDIENWYKQQPPGVLLRAKDTAEARLTNYAKDSIDAYMADFQKETEEGIIVGEIREIKKFWPQFGVNLAGGFVSALLFAALLTLVAFFVYNDISPVEIGAKLGEHTEDSSNEKKRDY